MQKDFLLDSLRPFSHRYIGVCLFEAAQASCGILTPLALGILIERVLANSTYTLSTILANRDIIVSLIFFLTLSILDMFCSRISGAIFTYTLGPQRHLIARNLFSRVLRYPDSFFTRYSPGLISHRISETSIGVNELTGCVLFDFWPTAIALIVATTMLYFASGILGSVILFWLISYFIGSVFFANACKARAVAAAERENHTNGEINDAIANALIIRLYNGYSTERERLGDAYASELAAINCANKKFETVRWWQFGAMTILVIVMLTFAIVLLQAESIGIGIFAMIVGLIINIINYTHNLSQRLLDFFNYWGKVGDGVVHLVRDEAPRRGDAPTAWTDSSQSDIDFQQVSLGFEDGKQLFREFNLNIPEAQRVGIVGLSGAGKSSLINLLVGLHSPDLGRILIGRLEVNSTTVDIVRERVATIPQGTLLFNRSIEENIRYGSPRASLLEVQEAASLANAANFIERLPGRYSTLLGATGVQLSGGELQRIAIARALLKKAPILVFDEATANLDAITEEAIHRLIAQNANRQTILVISHGMRLLSAMDRVVVLREGSIVEDGTPGELLSRDGFFREIWQANDIRRDMHAAPPG